MSREKGAESIEVSARNAEEAIALGLARLGLSRDEVEIEILSEGSRGILGIRAQEARVKLTPQVPPKSKEEPGEALAEEPAEEAPKAEPAEEIIEPKAASAREPEPASLAPHQVAEAGTEILQELTAKMGFRTRVSRRREKEAEAVTLEVSGENLAPLIGRAGQTLRALEYITRLIVSHRLSQRVFLNVDVQGYWLHRENHLKELARKATEEALAKGEAALPPMPPRERRIIHLELKDHPQVTTQSTGQGDARRVMVLLRSDAEGKEKEG